MNHRELVRLTASLAVLAGTAGLPLTLASAHSASGPAPVRAHRACPAHDRQPLTSTTAGARRALVPAGARQVMLCRYGGVSTSPAKPFGLVAQRLITDHSTVFRLASRFNRLRQFGKGTLACPMDTGSKIIALFRYASPAKSDDPVTLDPGGCAPVTNGRAVRTAEFPPGPALTAQLLRLT